EDGIRDLIVTGVQTCALPISEVVSNPLPETVNVKPADPIRDDVGLILLSTGAGGLTPNMAGAEAPPPGEGFTTVIAAIDGLANRSEERRVGKEWRCRRTRD